MSHITVLYGEDRNIFALEDVTPEELKDFYELQNTPKFLCEQRTSLTIKSNKWKTNLKPGEVYILRKQNVSTSKEVSEEEKIGGISSADSHFNEIVLHSLIASTAVYDVRHDGSGNEKLKQYLYDQLDNHFFDYVITSKHGENHYLIAKQKDYPRVYISFRGSKDLLDWKYNLQATRESACSSIIKGKFHSGFMSRADLFPIDKILDQERFHDQDIVLCGHSLGGAIASIIAIKLLARLHFTHRKKSIQCITFGAPLYGDTELQKFCQENISQHLHNYVCNNDPVPNLLRYTQSVSPKLREINNRLTAIQRNMSNDAASSFYGSQLQKLLEAQRVCNSLVEKVEQVMPIIGTVFDVVAVVHPGLSIANEVRKLISLAADFNTGIKKGSNVYQPIGNFHFLDNDKVKNKVFDYKQSKFIEEFVDYYHQQNSNEITPDSHVLSHYTKLFESYNDLPFNEYPIQIESATGFEGEITLFENREILFPCAFEPRIHSVELTTVKGVKQVLRLCFIGLNLYEVVLDLCQFGFNFPFAKNKEETHIKKISLGENIERLLIEEPIENNSININDNGSIIKIVTQFGEVEVLIKRENIRNINIESVEQIAQHDSVSHLVRRALQRGLALKKIKADGGCSKSEPLMEEILNLGRISVGDSEMDKIEEELFNTHIKDSHFMLSNEDAFKKVKEFCDKIESYIRSPLEIEGEKSFLQNVMLALSITVGAVAFGYLAGPGLVMIGLAEVTSTGLAVAGGAAGAVGLGAGVNAYLTERLTDNNYKNALKWILQELYKAQRKNLSTSDLSTINDLIHDDATFSNEKALIKLASGEVLEKFSNCDIQNCTARSKEEVRKRIRAIKSIHKIRKIFSQQCFIGIVGLQDAGKTTLVQKIWGVGGKTGYFSHTDAPQLYQMTSKVMVIDFPGSNSLDYHSKTFSICGAMNNMIIVIIPYSGDVSQILSDEIRKVFSVMRGSDSTKIILCINKCGLYLNDLKKEIDRPNPIAYLKKRFVDKLNEHYERNQEAVILKEEHIVFTDWFNGDGEEARNFGIVGVEEIKDQIKRYMINYGIYKSDETKELEKCVSTL